MTTCAFGIKHVTPPRCESARQSKDATLCGHCYQLQVHDCACSYVYPPGGIPAVLHVDGQCVLRDVLYIG